MREDYVSDTEYAGYYEKLAGIRRRIAYDLQPQPGMKVLDLATGPGYFAIELAEICPDLQITAIDITSSAQQDVIGNSRRRGVANSIEFLLMDATGMDFPDRSFDLVTSFAGLEDIHMTSGSIGVEKVFQQVARVLKPRGRLAAAVMPPDMMESRAQQLEVELFSCICGATWLPSRDYYQLLTSVGLKDVVTRSYHTGKILTAKQAQEEIRFACEQVPRIYGVKVISFAEAWRRFGPQIEQHGLGHFSKVVLLEAVK